MRSLAGILLCALFTAPLAATAESDTVTFTFAPPDGTAFTTTLEASVEMTLGEMGTRRQGTVMTSRTVVDRTKDGWAVSSRLVSAEAARDGRPEANPMLQAMVGMEVVYILDADGVLLEIQGLESVREKMIQGLPPAAMHALGPALSVEAMLEREAAEWNGRVGDFLGETVRLGESRTGTSSFPLPTGGAVEFDVTTAFAERVPCPAGSCVRIRFAYGGDAAELARAMEKITGEVIEDAGGPKEAAPHVDEVSVEGSGERVVDPATMLIYSETIRRTIRAAIEQPGMGSVPSIRTEVREYTYSYE
jgi:hypothetical protein